MNYTDNTMTAVFGQVEAQNINSNQNENRMMNDTTKSAGVSHPAANMANLGNNIDKNSMEITKFNKAYTPISFGKHNSSTLHKEIFDGYSISECNGEVEGYMYGYPHWFRELVTPKSAKWLIDDVIKYHTTEKVFGCLTFLQHSNLKKFREFLVRYADGEFKVAKERWSNKGRAPKPKYFNELEKRYQNNITKMIDAITSAIG